MKINEVCKKSKLSEKAVRYYTENGITSPVVTEMNGRLYKEYSEEDVKKLLITTKLRNLGISVEDISKMFKTPQIIPEVLKDAYIKIKDKQAFENDIIENYSHIDFENIGNLDQFHSVVTELLKRKIMIQANPDFSKLDGLTYDQKEEMIKQRTERVKKRLEKGKREFLFVTIFCIFLSALFVLSFKPDGLLCCGTIIVMYIALTKRPNNKTSIAIALCFLIFAGIFIYAIPSRVEAYTKVPATRYYIDSNGEYRPDFDAIIGDENISSLLEPTTDKERLQEMYKEGYEKYIKAKKEHHKNKPFILIGIIIHIINTVNMIITSVMLIFSKELNEYLQYRKSKKLPN